jgi:hypothetical protein
MSKLKTPRDKKLASLVLDNRNVYGENDKASRKRIPLAKQESHQALRRAAKRPLQNLSATASEDDIVTAESEVKVQEIKAKRKSFKKRPDEPLGAILEYKKTGDWQALTARRR